MKELRAIFAVLVGLLCGAVSYWLLPPIELLASTAQWIIILIVFLTTGSVIYFSKGPDYKKY